MSQQVDKAGILLVWLLLACSCTSVPKHQRQAPALNVVLLLTDDQGAHLSHLGTPGIRTPNIDWLAATGFSFTNAFAAVPSCSPSRSSINTGMYPHANGHWRNTITPVLGADDVAFSRASKTVDQVGIHEYITTLPEIFRDAGYFTGITQKFHLSPPWKFPYTVRNPVHNDPEEYHRVIDQWLEEAGDQPFFIQANISPPHRPLHKNLAQFPEYRVHHDSIAVPADLPDTPQLRADLAEYFGNVQLADACVGAMLQVLKERGLLENTIVIFTSDQGPAYQRAKASAYYAGLHVPLIWHGPGVSVRGKQSEALVSLIDLMPTLLEVLELPIPATVQGKSFRGILAHTPEAQYKPYVYGEHNSHGPARAEHYPSRMVFDGRYYYIRNLLPGKTYELPADLRVVKGWGNHAYAATVAAAKSHPLPYTLLRQLEEGRPEEELYDMMHDPHQINNLAGEGQYAAKQLELAAALDAWRLRTGDLADDPSLIPTRLQTKPSTDQ